MASSGPKATVPAKPRLVLRLAVVGNRDIPSEAEASLRESLKSIYETIGHRLAAIAPGTPVKADQEYAIARYYESACPLLRIVTGLSEGADAIAATTRRSVAVGTDGYTEGCLNTELAAVLPFDIDDYRKTFRAPEFQPVFDALLAECAYVVTVDGKYEKPEPDTNRARRRRARAYRAQAAMILRHADLIVTALDPEKLGRAGGTRETMQAALEFGLPVICLDITQNAARILLPGDDLDEILASYKEFEAPTSDRWKKSLESLVTEIVADPDLESSSHSGHGHRRYSIPATEGVAIFFDENRPPMIGGEGVGSTQRISFRERVWAWFEGRFRLGRNPVADSAPAAYAAFRDRATSLNYYYAGLYRGAFLLNYVLAIVAVALAALSLVLMALSPEASPGMLFVLLILGAFKLAILAFIAVNTKRANGDRWNDLAVDYRYLAERLRTLFYLPRFGSFRPPKVERSQYASRVVRQSAVDWLFDAITRSVSPVQFATRKEVATSQGGTMSINVLCLDRTEENVAAVRDSLITEQAAYHERTARTMELLNFVGEQTARFFAIAVIAAVAVDMLLTIGIWSFELAPLESHSAIFDRAHALSPWFVFLAAILPAAVASINGIRFQSECQRIAERSRFLQVLLTGHADSARVTAKSWWARFARGAMLTLIHASGRQRRESLLSFSGGQWQRANDIHMELARATSKPDNLGSHCLQGVRLAEDAAQLLAAEVAEWSVLYAKEVVEPG